MKSSVLEQLIRHDGEQEDEEEEEYKDRGYFWESFSYIAECSSYLTTCDQGKQDFST